jgi:hypothetical protein
MSNIKDLANASLQRHLEIIRSAPKDSIIYQANQHLLDDSGTTWAGGGLLEFGGLYWWWASCELLLGNISSTMRGVQFSAKGTGPTAGGFECEVAGAFVVDPATIGGSCNCVIGAGAFAEGVVSLTLLSPTGTLYGNFYGNATGIGFSAVNGSGSLDVI